MRKIEVLPSGCIRETPFPLTKLDKPFGFHINIIISYTGFSDEPGLMSQTQLGFSSTFWPSPDAANLIQQFCMFPISLFVA